jgi:cytochrome oxidase Cu insertion factor (SCO1/SenC/PrrC family)
MGRRSRIALPTLAGVLAVALILLVTLGGGSGDSTSKTFTASPASGFDGAALPAGQAVRDFTLTDQDGHRVTLSSLHGQVTVLAFLYSTCGAPCVVIAQQIRGALDDLAHPVPVLIVSADPPADTPASVSRFLAQVSLTGRVRYLSGPLARLRLIWRAYHVVPASSGRTAFARYASVLLLDPLGEERVLFQSEQLTPETLAHDIEKLDGDPTHP